MIALQKSVTGNVLFTHLEADELTDVLDAMFLSTKKPGEVVIQQGDEGDNFYIIDSGIVEVGPTSSLVPILIGFVSFLKTSRGSRSFELEIEILLCSMSGVDCKGRGRAREVFGALGRAVVW
jgi:hypothetical protein